MYRSKPSGSYMKKVRIELLEEDPRCKYCKVPLELSNSSVDHVIPKCKGGTHDRDNLVLCCLTCNKLKKDNYWFIE